MEKDASASHECVRERKLILMLPPNVEAAEFASRTPLFPRRIVQRLAPNQYNPAFDIPAIRRHPAFSHSAVH